MTEKLSYQANTADHIISLTMRKNMKHIIFIITEFAHF